MVLRRLSGKTDNTAPVLTLITQFGGGKTHTLTALYHLGTSGDKAAGYSGVSDLLRDAGLSSVPKARVGVFVRKAWDPQDGKERRGRVLPRLVEHKHALDAGHDASVVCKKVLGSARTSDARVRWWRPE